MTTPDTTTPEAEIEKSSAPTVSQVVENEPDTAEATSEVKTEIAATTTEAAPAAEVATTAAVVASETPVATESAAPAATAVAAPVVVEEEEDPQSTVFSLVTFFLAALPVVGVILNAIAVARAGKEGFDLWLARWGLALAIIETIGALLLVGLGYYFGLLSAGAV